MTYNIVQLESEKIQFLVIVMCTVVPHYSPVPSFLHNKDAEEATAEGAD
jgi:hypothetical protein